MLYTWLETTTPQPKPEQGLFLETRYRISRNLILSGLQFDKWKRKADGADLMRYTIKGEYQPIFNLRFRVRHRYSSRSRERSRRRADLPELGNPLADDRPAEQLQPAAVHLHDQQRDVPGPASGSAARPSPAIPSDSVRDLGVGTNGSPSNAFEVRYEHQLTPGLKLTFASSVYDGFFWNFEGNEFVLLDGNGFRNWFKVESRVSERLLFQLKVTRDHNMPKTYIDIREFRDDAVCRRSRCHLRARRIKPFVRLQMDYTF